MLSHGQLVSIETQPREEWRTLSHYRVLSERELVLTGEWCPACQTAVRLGSCPWDEGRVVPRRQPCRLYRVVENGGQSRFVALVPRRRCFEVAVDRTHEQPHGGGSIMQAQRVERRVHSARQSLRVLAQHCFGRPRVRGWCSGTRMLDRERRRALDEIAEVIRQVGCIASLEGVLGEVAVL